MMTSASSTAKWATLSLTQPNGPATASLTNPGTCRQANSPIPAAVAVTGLVVSRPGTWRSWLGSSKTMLSVNSCSTAMVRSRVVAPTTTTRALAK